MRGRPRLTPEQAARSLARRRKLTALRVARLRERKREAIRYERKLQRKVRRALKKRPGW